MENIPILEYDNTFNAVIQPTKDDYDFTLPDLCIAVFFKDVIDQIKNEPTVVERGHVSWETGDVVYYTLSLDGEEICFYHSWVGAAISGAVLDLTIALGAKQIISIGGCGIINKELLKRGDPLLIPVEGLRDEGTSYHYISPSRTIQPSKTLVARIISYFNEHQLKYSNVKTWTTDGFYRETEEKVKHRKDDGCDVVEMEFSAMCAVSEFRGVDYAAIFYCGDIVEMNAYDERDWQNNITTRNNLFHIALEILKGLRRQQ